MEFKKYFALMLVFGTVKAMQSREPTNNSTTAANRWWAEIFSGGGNNPTSDTNPVGPVTGGPSTEIVTEDPGGYTTTPQPEYEHDIPADKPENNGRIIAPALSVNIEDGYEGDDIEEEENENDNEDDQQQGVKMKKEKKRMSRHRFWSRRTYSYRCKKPGYTWTVQCQEFLKRWGANNIPNGVDIEQEFCSSVEFDDTVEKVCCGGVLYTRTDDVSTLVCCGGTLIQPDKFIGKHNQHGGCCGNEIIDTRCFKCEEDIRVVLAEDADKECYNEYKKRVAASRKTDRQGSGRRQMFRRRYIKKYVKERLDGHLEILKDGENQDDKKRRRRHRHGSRSATVVFYDAEQRLCLSNKTGTMKYNTRHEICCNGSIHKKRINGTNMSCCGKKTYNVHHESCCEGTIIPNEQLTGQTGPMCCLDTLIGGQSECFSCRHHEALFDPKDDFCCTLRNVTRKISEFLQRRCRHGKLIHGTLYEDTVLKVASNSKGNNETPHQAVTSKLATSTMMMIMIAGCTGVLCFTCIICMFMLIRKRRHGLKTKHIKTYNNLEYNKTSNEDSQKGESEEVIRALSYHGGPSVEADLKSAFPDFCPTPDFVGQITKLSRDIPDKNLLCNVFIESGTQTTGIKASNKRNIFGREFEFSERTTASTRTVSFPGTDVRLILPESLYNDGARSDIEVLGSAPSSMPMIKRKYQFAADESLCSPTMEYCITGDPEFKDHAIVVMPFFGSIQDLRVWKALSDEGAYPTSRRIKVPRLDKYTPELEYFYIYDSDINTIRIFTKGFSVFFCSTCKRYTDLRLVARPNGSYRRAQGTGSDTCGAVLSIGLFIADGYGFPQYKQNLDTVCQEKGWRSFSEKRIKLLQGTQEHPLLLDDKLQLNVSVSAGAAHDDLFQHKKVDGSILYDPITSTCMRELVNCHQDNGSAYLETWVLEYTGNNPPREVTVYIRTVSHRQNDTQAQYGVRGALEFTLKFDDVETNFGLMEVNRGNEELKDYLVQEITPSKQEMFIKNLRSLYPDMKKGKVTDNLARVLEDLERCRDKETFQSHIARALRICNLGSMIHRMVDKSLLGDHTLPIPQQVTGREGENQEDYTISDLVSPDPEDLKGTPEEEQVDGNDSQTMTDAHDIHGELTNTLADSYTANQTNVEVAGPRSRAYCGKIKCGTDGTDETRQCKHCPTCLSNPAPESPCTESRAELSVLPVCSNIINE